MRLALLLPLLFAALPAHAGNFGGELGIASDEVFRGLSQNNGLTVSGRADYAFDAHSYLGARALNNRSAGDAEFDVYGGYSRGFQFRAVLPYTLDAGVAARFYTGDEHGPRAQNLDFAEGYAGIAAGPARLTVYYAPDYYNFGAPGYRANGQLKLPLRIGLNLIGTLAWNDGDGVRRLIAGRSADGRGHAYLDYSATLAQDLPLSFSVSLQVAGTDLDVDGRRFPRVVLGLRRRFGF